MTVPRAYNDAISDVKGNTDVAITNQMSSGSVPEGYCFKSCEAFRVVTPTWE
jgi:hypothetical protein